MARLVDGISRFFGRVEILARGADADRRAAEEALARGLMLEARSHARALVQKVPTSPIGLALWADAAAACWFDEEVFEALSRLLEQMPWRHDLWLRAGQAGLRCAATGARSCLERAAHADDPHVARSALFELADLDIAAGQHARAVRWLDRVPSHASERDSELALRRIECAMALGDHEQARRFSSWLDGDSGRARLAQARLAELMPDSSFGGAPLTLALGALIFEVDGAEEVVARMVASCDDAVLLSRVRQVLAAREGLMLPRWRAAFALAEGRQADARSALTEAADGGDASAIEALLSLAMQQRDLAALAAVFERAPELLDDSQRAVLQASAQHDAGDAAAALNMLAHAGGVAGGWEQLLERSIVASLVPDTPNKEASWPVLLQQLRAAATALSRLDLVAPIEALAVERERPLLLAVLGEFNAGKSTFLNALLGTDVAPTGVRPTTACLHWVAWAPDPFARVVVSAGNDRVVPHAELKRTLEQLQSEGADIERVYIYAPIERLKHIEILDTPGFNAPDVSHAEQARRGIEEAHLALWLLDANAPMKDSERRIIEQVAEAAVPVQVLVNKIDRLGDGAMPQVMDYVARALQHIDIRSLQAPIAMSARQALHGRLGDEEALQDSNWPAVEAMLNEHIVDRRSDLREQALRRKAKRIAERLANTAREQAHDQQKRRQDVRDQVESCASAAALLQTDRSHRGRVASTILDALVDPLRALHADLLPLAAVADERRDDHELRAYVVVRSVERLVPAMVNSIVATLEMPDDFALIVDEPVRAAIAGAASSHASRLADDRLLMAIDVALSACGRALERHASHLRVTRDDDSWLQRLDCIRDALA